MKKILKLFGLIILFTLLCRGWIYRSTIHYTSIGERKVINITNQRLLQTIDQETQEDSLDIKQIIKVATQITNKTLNFTTKSTFKDPNKLFETHRANCVGYSAMFASIANYLIQKNGLKRQFEAKHLIGKIDFLGINLRQFFDDPFFKDHDYNQVKDLKEGKKIFIDPSVSDYLLINRVWSE